MAEAASILPGIATVTRRDSRVVLEVQGFLSWQDGRRTAEEFRRIVAGQKVEFVGELTLMEGYDRLARQAWQEALAAERPNLTRIWIVGASPMLRVAACAVALYAKVPMRVVDAIDELSAAG